MHRIAVHTRLKPGKEQEYERVHAVIPMPEPLDIADDNSGQDGGSKLVRELS
jgi:L-rhamnose mutarotase